LLFSLLNTTVDWALANAQSLIDSIDFSRGPCTHASSAGLASAARRPGDNLN
jgi:hypothetical protein